MTRKSALGIVCLLLLVMLGAGILASHPWRDSTEPLGESPLITYESTSAPDPTVRQFLEGDFALIRDVKSLPRPVRQAFTEAGGSRLVLADPGQRFEATDVIRDTSLPRKRLIFAGVSGNKCFVHYEQGGLGHYFLVSFFELTSVDRMRPIWRGYCGPARDLSDLRLQVDRGCR
jgi:hypothetical protein